MGRWGTEGKKEGGQAATDEGGGGGERLWLERVASYMLLDVSRLILYSLPLIDPPSVKHSLSLPLSKQLCIIFLFSHSVSLVDGRDGKASGHAGSVNLLGHISLPPPIYQLPSSIEGCNRDTIQNPES